MYFSYICDEYVIGDNENGDIQTIRSALTDIGTMSPQEAIDKGGKLLQSYTHQQEISRQTVLCFIYLLKGQQSARLLTRVVDFS